MTGDTTRTTVRELIDMLQSEVDAAGGRDDFEVRLCNFGPALEEQGILATYLWTNRGANPDDRDAIYIDFNAYEDDLPTPAPVSR